MRYSVEFSKKARRELKKLDNNVALTITNWVRKNLEGCENPRSFGKSLTGNYSGKWCYRIGDYRLIAEIQDDKIIILVTAVGYRREIY